MNARGQALVEYALITIVLVAGIAATQPWWIVFLNQLGIYNSSFDAVLSAPFP
jgi:hypothetical protein